MAVITFGALLARNQGSRITGGDEIARLNTNKNFESERKSANVTKKPKNIKKYIN